MQRQSGRLAHWLNRAQWEGQDDYGIYELTMGVALLLAFLFFALLPRVTLLTSLPMYVLLAAAAWYGSVLEHRQLRTLGRRRARGMLSLGITWVTLAQSLLLAGLLLGGAHLAGWSHVRGWSDGPLLVALVAGLQNVSQGARLGIRRRLWLGLALCAFAVPLAGLPALRERLFLSTAVLVGGGQVLSGLIGRQALQQRLRRDGYTPSAPGAPY